MQLNCGNIDKLTYGLLDIEAPLELSNWWLSQWADDAACSCGCKRPWMFLSFLGPVIVTRGWVGSMRRMCVSGLHSPGLLPRTNKTLLRFCSRSTSQQRERKYVTLSRNRNDIAKAFLLNHQHMPLQQPSFLWLIYKEVFQLDTTFCVVTKKKGKSALAASKQSVINMPYKIFVSLFTFTVC